MGTAPHRRLEWLVRLVFYPAAIALIALAWHERQASADDDGARPAVRVIELVGGTSQGLGVVAHVAGRRPTTLRADLDFACPSGSPQDFQRLNYGDVVSGAREVAAAGAHVVTDTHLDHALVGGRPAVVRVRSDSRAGPTSWRGTITGEMKVDGVTCRTGRVAYTADRAPVLRTPGPSTLTGATDLGGAVRVTRADGRIQRIEVSYHLRCTRRDVEGWFHLWTGTLEHQDGVVRQDWPAWTTYAWRGHRKATMTAGVAAQMDGLLLRGSFWVVVRPRGRAGSATCGSGTVPFALRVR
jgi:hypothetical protein